MRTTPILLVLALATLAPVATASPLEALDAPAWTHATYEDGALQLAWAPPQQDPGADYQYRLYQNGILLETTNQTHSTVLLPAPINTYWITAEHNGHQSSPSTPLTVAKADAHPLPPMGNVFAGQSAMTKNADGPCGILLIGVDPNHFPFIFYGIQEECIPSITGPFHVDFTREVNELGGEKQQ